MRNNRLLFDVAAADFKWWQKLSERIKVNGDLLEKEEKIPFFVCTF